MSDRPCGWRTKRRSHCGVDRAAIVLAITRTAMKALNATMKNSTSEFRNMPYRIATAGAVICVAASRIGFFSTISRFLKSTPPIARPSGGMIRSETIELMILLNAAPTTIPIAISMAFPLTANDLKSSINLPNILSVLSFVLSYLRCTKCMD